MDAALTQLRAAAEPTRLRLLLLCARAAFCVSELTAILGQSQPRLSRHLKLLLAADLLECSREGAHAWFSAAPGWLAAALGQALPPDHPDLAADARAAARVLAERERLASDQFRRQGADWDEMRALGLPAASVEAALLACIQNAAPPRPRLLDIGTGTGRLLELCAPHAAELTGIDASPAMLALARTRLARAGLAKCRVRRADAYRLPFADEEFDLATLHMLLHHAAHPAAMLAEAARILRPGGLALVVELAPADPAHRTGPAGFAAPALVCLLGAVGLDPLAPQILPGPRQILLCAGRKPLHQPAKDAA